jgi:hypothetical protein
MNMLHEIKKKFYSLRSLLRDLRPLAPILYGLVIAVLIELLAHFLLPWGISLVISFAGFLIIYSIDIIIFNMILSGKHPNVINALKSHPDYFFSFFMVLMALGFTFLLSNFLYVFLRMSGIRELLQLYPMLFAGAITSVSIMFAVTYWVVNRVENIAELTETIQHVKALSTYAYILALFFVFASLPIISSPSSSTSTLLLYLISFLLSYPFGLTAGMIQTSIMLDVLAVTLRYKLSEKR